MQKFDAPVPGRAYTGDTRVGIFYRDQPNISQKGVISVTRKEISGSDAQMLHFVLFARIRSVLELLNNNTDK